MRRQVFQTGGGPPPQDENDPLHEMVRSVVPTISLTVENPWDSTSAMINKPLAKGKY